MILARLERGICRESYLVAPAILNRLQTGDEIRAGRLDLLDMKKGRIVVYHIQLALCGIAHKNACNPPISRLNHERRVLIARASQRASRRRVCLEPGAKYEVERCEFRIVGCDACGFRYLALISIG